MTREDPKLDEMERQKEKHFIVSMDMPHYPILPVVKKNEQKCGIIIAGDNDKLPLKVYLGNTFALKDEGITNIEQLRLKCKYIEFNTLDKFLDSGWRVD